MNALGNEYYSFFEKGKLVTRLFLGGGWEFDKLRASKRGVHRCSAVTEERAQNLAKTFFEKRRKERG